MSPPSIFFHAKSIHLILPNQLGTRIIDGFEKSCLKFTFFRPSFVEFPSRVSLPKPATVCGLLTGVVERLEKVGARERALPSRW